MQNPDAPTLEGLPAREAALKMLDAILRRGQTMDNAAQHAKNLLPADAALASAITGETLRRLPDLDALIDSATRLPLADDAKARMVLRLALAQKIGLGTPDHALVATALPLVDGGPRKLVHGVLGTLLRAGIAPIDLPLLPSPVFERWSRAWGPQVAAAASTHFVVTKEVVAGRTHSELREVTSKARREEIARMLGGQSESALKHAATLLKGSAASSITTIERA